MPAVRFGSEANTALWQQVTTLLEILPDRLMTGFAEADGDKSLEDFALLTLKQPEPLAFATRIRDLLTTVSSNTPNFRNLLFETAEKEGMQGLANVQDLAVKLRSSGWMTTQGRKNAKGPLKASSRLFPGMTHHDPWRLPGQGTKTEISTELEEILGSLMKLNLRHALSLGEMYKQLDKLTEPPTSAPLAKPIERSSKIAGKVFLEWLKRSVQGLEIERGKGATGAAPNPGSREMTDRLEALVTLAQTFSQGGMSEEKVLESIAHVSTRMTLDPGGNKSEKLSAWQAGGQLLKTGNWPTGESREAFIEMLGKVWSPDRLSTWQQVLANFPGPPHTVENYGELLVSLDRKLAGVSPEIMTQIQGSLHTLVQKFTPRKQFDSLLLVLQELVMACDSRKAELQPVTLLARADTLTELFVNLPSGSNLIEKLKFIKALALREAVSGSVNNIQADVKDLFSNLSRKSFISEQVFLMLKRTESLEKARLAKKWLLVFDQLLTRDIKSSPPAEAAGIKEKWKPLFRFITLTAWDKLPLNQLEAVFNGLAAWMRKHPAPSPQDDIWLDTARQSLGILFEYLHAGNTLPPYPEQVFERMHALRQQLGAEAMTRLFSNDFFTVLADPASAKRMVHMERLAVVTDLAMALPPERRNESVSLLLYLLRRLSSKEPGKGGLPVQQWSSLCQGVLDVALKCPDFNAAQFEDTPGSDTPLKPFRMLFDACLDGCVENRYAESLAVLLNGTLALRAQVKARLSQSNIKPIGSDTFIWDSILRSGSLEALVQRVENLCSLMVPGQSPDAQESALNSLMQSDFEPEQEAFLRPILQNRLNRDKTLGPLGILLTRPVFREMAPALLEKILDRFEHLKEKDGQDKFLPEIAQLSRVFFEDYPEDELLISLLDTILALPGQWKKTAEVFHYLRFRPKGVSIEAAIADPERMHAFRENAQLLAYSHFPTQLLNHFMLNQPEVETTTLQNLYGYVEYGGAGGQRIGKKALPELMALLVPYASRWDKTSQDSQKDFMAPASGALTSLYRFSSDTLDGEPIPRIDGIVLNNWAKIGTTGLSFTKWQWDAMRRWKGQGPMEQPTLLEKSGFFKRIPPRADDAKYQGGFLHYDPTQQVSVELRRAYMVISKPGLGTLVIRNSSPVFGRNLMPEPAYFSLTHVLSDGSALFSPEKDLKKPDFQHIFSKRLHAPMNVQVENHEKIQALLQAFDQVMAGYTQWKCGFQKGRQPEGFGELLKTAMMSASNEGVSSPFGAKKNIRPVWVNPYGLPMPLASFDITKPELQAEIAFYLSVLGKKKQVLTAKEYETKIPNLLNFLKLGLERGWELTLTEAGAGV